MKFKRLLAAILSALMITSCFSFVASAEETSTEEASTVTITFNRRNGARTSVWNGTTTVWTNLAVTTAELVPGEAMTFPDDPTYSRHTFRGWSTSINGDIIDKATAVVPSTATTYYGVWDAEATKKDPIVSVAYSSIGAEGGTPTRLYDAVNDVLFTRSTSKKADGFNVYVNQTVGDFLTVGEKLVLVSSVRTNIKTTSKPDFRLYQASDLNGERCNRTGTASEAVAADGAWHPQMITLTHNDEKGFGVSKQIAYYAAGVNKMVAGDGKYFDVPGFAVFESTEAAEAYVADYGTPHKITFDLNYEGAEAIDGYIAAPERDGFAFAGWATTADATEVIADMTATAVPEADTTYYAIWVAEGTVEAANAVYVDGTNGDDSNDGRHSLFAVKTLAAAETILEKEENSALDTIYIVGSGEVTTGSTTFGVPNRTIKIKGYTGNADVFDITAGHLRLNGDVEFSNITIAEISNDENWNDGGLMAQGHNVTIGENVVITGIKSLSHYYYGGQGDSCVGNAADDAADAVFNVNSGSWNHVHVGTYTAGPSFYGKSVVNIDGAADINNVKFGHGSAVGFYGTFAVNVNGGTVGNIAMNSNSKANSYTGLRYFTINDGTVGNVYVTSKVAADTQTGYTVVEVNKAGALTGVIAQGGADDSATRVVIYNNGSYVADQVTDTGAIVLNVTGATVKADVTVADDYTATLNGYKYTLADETYDQVTIGEETIALADLEAAGVITADKFAAGVNNVVFSKAVTTPETVTLKFFANITGEETEPWVTKKDLAPGATVDIVPLMSDHKATYGWNATGNNIAAHPARVGYWFKGWAEAPDGEVTTVTATADKSYYAIWEQIEVLEKDTDYELTVVDGTVTSPVPSNATAYLIGGGDNSDYFKTDSLGRTFGTSGTYPGVSGATYNSYYGGGTQTMIDNVKYNALWYKYQDGGQAQIKPGLTGTYNVAFHIFSDGTSGAVANIENHTTTRGFYIQASDVSGTVHLAGVNPKNQSNYVVFENVNFTEDSVLAYSAARDFDDVIIEGAQFLGVYVWPANKVYISDTGDDENDGLTAETPVKSMGAANTLLAAEGKDTLVVVGTHTILNEKTEYAYGGEETIGVSGKTITIVGNTADAIFNMSRNYDSNKNDDSKVLLAGPVVFKNIVLSGDKNDGRIHTRGHKIEFDSTVTAGEKNASIAVIDNSTDAEIVINGGNFSRVFPGRFSGGTYTGKTTINIGGGTISKLGLAHGYRQAQTFKGTYLANINGGNVTISFAGGYQAANAYEGLRYFTINDGTVPSITTTSAKKYGENLANSLVDGQRAGVTVFEINKAGVVTGDIKTGGSDDEATRIILFNNDSYASYTGTNSDTNAITVNVIGGALKANVTVGTDYATTLGDYTYAVADTAYDQVTITPATGDAKTYKLADIAAIPAADLVAGTNKVEFSTYVEEPTYTLITPDEVKIVEAPTDDTGIPATATFIAANSVTEDSDGNILNTTNAGNYGYATKYFDTADYANIAVWYKNDGYIPYYTGLEAGTYNVTFRLHLKKNDGGVRGFSTDIDGKKVGTVHVSGTTSTEADGIYTSETYVTFNDVELSENALIKYGVVGGFNDSTIKGGDLIGIYVWQPTPETVTHTYYDNIDNSKVWFTEEVAYGTVDNALVTMSDKGLEAAGSNDVWARPVNPGYYFVGWGTTADATEVVDKYTYTATADADFYAIWEETPVLANQSVASSDKITITTVSEAANSPIPSTAEAIVYDNPTGSFKTTIAPDATTVAINASAKIPGLETGTNTTTSSYFGTSGSAQSMVLGSAVGVWYKWNDGHYIPVEPTTTGKVNVAIRVVASAGSAQRGFWFEAGEGEDKVTGTVKLTGNAAVNGLVPDSVITFQTTLTEDSVIKYAAPMDFDNSTIKSAQLLGVYVWPVEEEPVKDTVYLGDTGADTNDGLTADAPVLTMAKVQEILAANTDITTVAIVDTYTYRTQITLKSDGSNAAIVNTTTGFVLGVADRVITVTGADSEAIFDFDDPNADDEILDLAGDVTFKNIKVNGSTNDGRIETNGHTLTIDEGFEKINTNGASANSNFTPSIGADVKGTINIKAGNITRIYPGYFGSGTYSKTAEVNVSGANTYVDIIGLSHAWHNRTTYTGEVYVNVSDGATVGTIKMDSNGSGTVADYSGLRYFTIDGANVNEIITTGKKTGTDGSFSVTASYQTGVTVFEINEGSTVGSIAPRAETIDTAVRVILFNDGTYKDVVTDTGAITVDVRNGALKAAVNEDNTAVSGYTFTTDKTKVYINGTNYDVSEFVPTTEAALAAETVTGTIPADKLTAGENVVIFSDAAIVTVNWVVGETTTPELAEVGATLTATFNEIEMPESAIKDYTEFSQVNHVAGIFTTTVETVAGVEAVKVTPTAGGTVAINLEGSGNYPDNYSTGVKSTVLNPTIYDYAVIKYYYVPGTNTETRDLYMWYQKHPWNDATLTHPIDGATFTMEEGKWTYIVDKLDRADGATPDKSVQYHIRPMNGVAADALAATGEYIYIDSMQLFKSEPTVATVTFKDETGVLYAVDALNGEAVTYEGTAPAKDGSTFKGWAVDGTTEIVNEFKYTADTTLVAVFEENEPAFPTTPVYKTYGVYDEAAGTYTVELKLAGVDANTGSFGFSFPTDQMTFVSAVANTSAGINLFAEQASDDAENPVAVSPILAKGDGYYANTWAVENIDDGGHVDATEEEVLVVTFNFTMTPEQREAFETDGALTLTEYVIANADEKYHNGENYLVTPHGSSLTIERAAVVYEGHTHEDKLITVNYTTSGVYNPVDETYEIGIYVQGVKINAAAFGLAFNADYMTYDPTLDEETQLPTSVKFASGVDNYLGTLPANTATGLAFTWDGSGSEAGYIDAADEAVLVATVTVGMTDAQRTAFVEADKPMSILTLTGENIGNYFDGTDYLVAPYANGLEIERIKAPYAGHTDSELEITEAEVKVTVNFTGREDVAKVTSAATIKIGNEAAVEIETTGENVETKTAEYTKTLTVGETYKIRVEKNGYVAAETEITVTAAENNLVINLIPGDIKGSADAACGDGVVSLDDFVRVIRAFDELATSSEYKLSVDIDESGTVTVSDLNAIKNSFGKTTANTVITFNGAPVAAE